MKNRKLGILVIFLTAGINGQLISQNNNEYDTVYPLDESKFKYRNYIAANLGFNQAFENSLSHDFSIGKIVNDKFHFGLSVQTSMNPELRMIKL